MMKVKVKVIEKATDLVSVWLMRWEREMKTERGTEREIELVSLWEMLWAFGWVKKWEMN